LTNTRTLRIEEDLDEEIQRIAKKERASINQVANRALRRYVEWDSASSTRGLVSVPSALLEKLMESKTPAEARKLGRWAGTELFIPNTKAQFARVTVDTALRNFKMLSVYGGRFGFDHSLADGKHRILIRQALGPAWTSYYAGALEGVFEEFLGKKTKIRVTGDSCLCEFEG